MSLNSTLDHLRATPALFKSMREFLGLPAQWLAARLKVSVRTIRHWESGNAPITRDGWKELRDIKKETDNFIQGCIENCSGAHYPILKTYDQERTCVRDKETKKLDPRYYPATWHRRAMAQVAFAVPNLILGYTSPHSVDPMNHWTVADPTDEPSSF